MRRTLQTMHHSIAASRHPWLRRGLLGALLLLMLAAPAFAGYGNSPTARALSPLGGDSDSFGRGLNNRGQVAGYSQGATTTAVRWDRNGSATPLLPLGADLHSFGEAINNRGEVVGRSRSGQGDCAAFGLDRAVVWDKHGVATELVPLPGHVEARGYGINNRGSAVGISLGPRADPAGGDCSVTFTAVTWDRDGNPTELASPSSVLVESFANDISNNGAVAGFIYVDSSTAFEFAGATWDRHGVPTMLPGPAGSIISAAERLNNRGVIVGYDIDISTFATSALLWDKGGNLSTLPPLSTDPEAVAADINDSGSVAGSSGTLLAGVVLFFPGATGSAVIWDKHGVPTALPPLSAAADCFGLGINDPGHVVGYCLDSGGATTAVIWR